MSSLLILNYHRVGFPDSRARYRGMWVSPKLLALQIRLLQMRGYQFTTVSSGLEHLSNGGRWAAVTFDDGYLDNIVHGLPVLQRLHVPATVYVVTGDVGRSQVIWRESGDQVPADLMTWEQLRMLQNCGWEIGSHAADHIHLDRASGEMQQELIATSFVTLQRELTVPPRSLAYPYGCYNATTMRLVQAAGFQNAVTTQPGTNSCEADVWQLKRYGVGGVHLRHFLKSLRMLAW